MDNLREFVVSTPVGLRKSGASVSAALVASRIFRLTGLFASLLPLFAIGGCPPASDTSGNLDSNPTAVLGEIVENSTPGTKFSAQPIVTATFVNQPLTISLPVSEGGNAAIELVTAPTLGTLSELAAQSDGGTTVTFTPPVDAVGIAQFNYRIRAEGLVSDSATVTIHVYPEVRFQAVGTEEAGLLRIFAQASAPPGYELPEGSYNWGINGGTESGPVSTHFVFERTFSVRRTYLISLTLTLVGFAAPIPCLAGPDGGDPEIEILWGDTDTTGPVESTPIRISGRVLDDTGGVTDVQVTATGGAQALTDSTGAFDFTVSSGWSGSITPALQGWVFDPPIRSYSNLTLPITDADFSGKPISGPPDLRVFPPDGVVTSGPRDGVFDPSRFEFLLTNIGTEPLSWSAGKSANWLTLSRTAGTLAPGETFTVVVDLNSAAENLPIGQHVDTLAFTNKTNGLGSTTRSFDLTVTPRPAELTATPSSGLESSGDQGGPFDPAQIVYQLTNSGDESLSWTAGKTANWLDLSPSSGTLSAGATASLTVAINSNANGLTPGRHEDMVSIVNATNGRGSSSRSIGLDVNPPAGELSVSPSSGLSGSGNQGGPFNPAGKDYTLKNNGGEPITWSATTNGSWFGLSKTSGTLFAGATETLNVSFTAAANSLGSGVYNGKVTITNDTNGSGNTTRNVMLDVNAIPIANAGSDQTIEDTDNNGTESVTLNGGASSDPDGTITNYRWTRGSTELYNGPNSSVTVTLGAGSHSITLTVTDNDGAMKSDGVVVTVDGVNGDEASWTHDGFDIALQGVSAVGNWDPYTKERYAIVPVGGTVLVSVIRRPDLRNANGDLSQDGVTRIHFGLLQIGNGQMWTPDFGTYDSSGSFEYSDPFETDPISTPTPIQIWNQHPGIDFDSSDWLAYGSNALELWLIPEGMVPGDIQPVNFSNGRNPAGELLNAPTGLWPRLYRDSAEETRLRAAIDKFASKAVQKDSGPYDRRGNGNYMTWLASKAAQNALLGWHLQSSAHLSEAKKQLLAVHSVRLFSHEYAAWARARVVPCADLLTLYGREQADVFFNALVAACALGPNMANSLSSEELASINAHLYRYAFHDLFASLTEDQYYTADGGINLHYHTIIETAAWNWNVTSAMDLPSLLQQPTQTECCYFIDSDGIGQFALRYCQQGNPNNKGYEDVGNSQSVRFWKRFSEYFGVTLDVEAASLYVNHRYGGQSKDQIWNALDTIMDNYAP